MKDLQLTLKRFDKQPECTFGKLYINDEFFCYTLEDTDRGLKDTMSTVLINKKKIYGETAIPSGTYEVIINYSNRFKVLMPLLLNVKGFLGIRIHPGNDEFDTYGCILVGNKLAKEKILNSRVTYNKLFTILKNQKNNKVFITIE